jgi:chromosome segregation protein
MHAPVPAEYTAPWIIAGERAIDVPKVRDAIKAIMEGGEAAFNLRKKKYGF